MNSTQTINENLLQGHHQDISFATAIVFCTTALICALGALCIFLRCFFCDKKAHPWAHEQLARCASIFFVTCLWFAAAAVFLGYAISLKKRDKMDYQGLMRVTGVEFKETQRGKDFHPYLDPVLLLDWGYDWGCPNNPKQCQSKLTWGNRRSRRCSQYCHGGCTEEDRATAEEAVMDCLNEHFGFSIETNSYTPTELSPSQDIWPVTTAYGDCSTCDVSWNVVSPGTLDALSIAGFVFLSLGLLCAAIFAILLFRPRTQNPEAELHIRDSFDPVLDDATTATDEDEAELANRVETPS